MFEFGTCKSLICGIDSSKQIPELAEKLGVSQLLIVTDQGLIDTGILTPITDSLEAHSLEYVIFSGVLADPPESLVLEAVAFAESKKIDGVVGIGGGSSMDVGKLIAVLCNAKQPLSEMYGIDAITENRLPLIQVPTTAGTGSEVTPISIITTGETTKTGVVSSQLLPDFAILDPKLTVGLPPHVTAATGVDAMVHAIEAFTSKNKKNPYSDMLAIQALNLLYANIESAVSKGSDLKAREGMLLGAMMAGQAFANAPVAAVHALAYPLGGHYHIPHGLSNSLVLPPVLRFNATGAAENYSQLSISMGIGDTNSSAAKNCALFIETLEGLITKVGLPTKLRDCGVNEQDLPLLAKDAMLQTRLLINNPVELLEANALEIYNAVF